MLKRSLIRGVNSFMYAIGIYTIIQVILVGVVEAVTGTSGMIPVLPEFAAHFQNPYMAVYVQAVLIGLTSAVFGAGSVILELERISLVAQSVLYFLVTMAVWVPVGCFCWGLHKYPTTMISVGLSYVISYSISWVVQYRLCKQNVEKINERLLQLREEGNYELCNRA